MTKFDPQYVQNGDVRLAAYSFGAPSGSPILLLHGWPEIAYSWRHMVEPLARAGHHVIAVDLRGFGRSDAPEDVGAYGMAHLVSDIEAVLDEFGHGRAVICGHDWGGIIVWNAARMISARISKVISICTPHIRRAPVDPIAIFKKRFGEAHYFVHFNERPGVADKLFARDPDAFFRMMFRTVPKGAVFKPVYTQIPEKFEAFLAAGAPSQKGEILEGEDRQVFIDAYRRSGFSGGINLYRNTTANWELSANMSEDITQPTLMISPEDDLILPPALTDPMVDMVADLTRVIIPNCGHWAMWEQPEAITNAMLEWLS